MINIGIVTGSIRETRVNLQVAEWVKSFADNKEMEEVNFEILDIKETGLANFNETVPPLMAETYSTEAQTSWSEKVKKWTVLFLLHLNTTKTSVLRLKII